jgi:hypothetical protein
MLLIGGASVGVVAGLAFGSLGRAATGLVLGLLLGLLYILSERISSDRITKQRIIDAPGDYPEDLRRVEGRHLRWNLILIPSFTVSGIGISWILFDTGIYGVLPGFLAAVLALWALGRFGGPADPKWKRVRADWERHHMETAGASEQG